MLQRRFWTHVTHLAMLGTFALAAGCAGRGPTAPTDDEAAGPETAKAVDADGDARTQGHFKGGPQRLLRAALESLDLSAEQRTTIQSALEDIGPADRTPMKSVFTTLAAGVRAGKIDDAAMSTQLEAVGRGAKEQRAKVVAALQKLHDTLTPAQRTALVASIEKRISERAAEGEHGKAHEGREKHGKEGGKAPLARLLHGVDLSDAQRERVQQALAGAGLDETHGKGAKPDGAEMRAKGKAMLESFKTDRFDAAALVPERDGSPRARLDNVVKAVKAVVPVLDQAQRAKLADNLEKGPKHRGHKGGSPG